jgi:DNA-binding GntR family transcriptional regulator
MTLEQRQAMIDGYAQKLNVSALARQYGVSRATVLGILKTIKKVS